MMVFYHRLSVTLTIVLSLALGLFVYERHAMERDCGHQAEQYAQLAQQMAELNRLVGKYTSTRVDTRAYADSALTVTRLCIQKYRFYTFINGIFGIDDAAARLVAESP